MISAIYSLACDWPDCDTATEIFKGPPFKGPVDFPPGWRSIILYGNAKKGRDEEEEGDDDWAGILCPEHSAQFEKARASAEDPHDA